MNRVSPHSSLAAVFLASCALAAGALAQGTGRPTDPAAVMFSASGSYSSRTDVEHRGAGLGEVAISAFQLAARSSAAIADSLQVSYGLEFGHYQIDRTSRVPLPDQLQELSVPLSVSRNLAPNWTARLAVRPGIYGDDLEVSARHINAPLLALATFRQSETLAWTLGLRYDDWSDYPVLPIAGVNWQLAPDWEFVIGLPRTGVRWRLTPHTALLAGASVQTGTFHLDVDPRPIGSAVPPLNSTKLDYREIRVGAALDIRVAERQSIVIDAGMIVSQRFDYDRRGYRLEGDAAPYAALSLRTRF